MLLQRTSDDFPKTIVSPFLPSNQVADLFVFSDRSTITSAFVKSFSMNNIIERFNRIRYLTTLNARTIDL